MRGHFALLIFSLFIFKSFALNEVDVEERESSFDIIVEVRLRILFLTLELGRAFVRC